jgi:hypothetical protein
MPGDDRPGLMKLMFAANADRRGRPSYTPLGASRSIFEGPCLDYWMSNVDAACTKNDLMQFVFGTAGCGRGESETMSLPVLFPDHSL